MISPKPFLIFTHTIRINIQSQIGLLLFILSLQFVFFLFGYILPSLSHPLIDLSWS
jgi:hypothetical protein